jgi:hypothetical protein
LRPPTIVGTRRARLHPHRPRRHYPPRHRNRHFVRSRQGPPLHRRHSNNKRSKDTRHKQDRPHPRQENCEDSSRQALLLSSNVPIRHYITQTIRLGNKRSHALPRASSRPHKRPLALIPYPHLDHLEQLSFDRA